MVNIKPILGATVGLQSVALLGRAAKLLKKEKKGPKAKPAKKFVKAGVDIMVGTAMIGATSSMINKI